MASIAIPRVAMPDDVTFYRDYVFARRPVIITNLFEGQPIREIDSFERAASAFGTMKLEVRPEYTSAGGASTKALPAIMTFDEYWAVVRADPSTDLLCTEYPTPARVEALFSLPSVCMARHPDGEEVLALPSKYGDHDLLSNAFIANRGNVAQLHYDGDHRQVLLYQVFGRKEVVLFRPESAVDLEPLGNARSTMGHAGIRLDEMSEGEKLELLDRTGGYHGTIHPGEAVYIPMLTWHYLRYADDGMSFNLRFGRNRYGRFLCVDNFHRDCFIQNFASRLADADDARTTHGDAIARVAEEYLKPAPDLRAKVRGVRALMKELCLEFCREARMDRYCPADREDTQLDRILDDIAGTMRYADPKILAAMRPVGPLSASQRSHIRSKAAQLGYSDRHLRHLLFNKTGKRDLSQLTMIEAAELLRYLTSPGAIWTA